MIVSLVNCATAQDNRSESLFNLKKKKVNTIEQWHTAIFVIFEDFVIGSKSNRAVIIVGVAGNIGERRRFQWLFSFFLAFSRCFVFYVACVTIRNSRLLLLTHPKGICNWFEAIFFNFPKGIKLKKRKKKRRLCCVF